MGSTTPRGYPFPLGTDRVMDGDDAIHALASAVDTNLGVAAGGVVTITPASGGGFLAVTFPAGRFNAVPTLGLATVATTSSDQVEARISGLSQTGCTVTLRRPGTTATGVYWYVALI